MKFLNYVSVRIRALCFRICEMSVYPHSLRLYFFIFIIRKFRWGSIRFRSKYDAIPYPHYAYGMINAALQARELGYESISAIEFGVAGGNGLVEMEKIAKEVKRDIGVAIKVFGFDCGSGLPSTQDYRDQIYFWAPGDFIMNEPRLRKKLTNAELVLGEVSQTAAGFFEKYKPSPIGFIAFDLDYYSSTTDAMKVFRGSDSFFLPRVECYFDDVNSFETLSASSHTGVLLAIAEFNQNSDTKVLKKENLSALRHLRQGWHEQCYVHHNFDHKRYNQFIGNAHLNQSELE